MTYQYSSFGVPGLGLRRGLGDDVVVAPYATALAAMFEPAAALRNLTSAGGRRRRRARTASTRRSTTRRRDCPAARRRAVVRAYMAHHQGMAIVAIGERRCTAASCAPGSTPSRCVRASELLLQERTPRDVAGGAPARGRRRGRGRTSASWCRRTTGTSRRRTAATPRTQLLSNGRYAVMITAAGSGYSRWRDLAVTRWREDVTSDDTGSYIYLRDVASGERWSAGFQPTGAVPETYDVSFAEDRAEFMRRDGAIATRLEVIVSTEDDAEVRRVSITNHGARAREIDVTSYAEIVLAPAASDDAHPAFSNLFIQTEMVPELDTLLATRRPRSPEEREIWLAHVLAVEGETIGDLQWETDRAQFLGRGQRARTALAETDGRDLSNTVGAVLDPIVSLRRRVRIRPGKTVHVAFSTLVSADAERGVSTSPTSTTT